MNLTTCRWLALLLLVGAAAELRASAPARSVVVAGGAGSGTFDTSRTIHVWADPPERGWIFDRWTGDVDALENAADPHTRILTSSTRVTVSVAASYRAAASWAPTSEAYNNGFARYHIPPGELRGLITLHHGRGGAGSLWFTEGEKLAFVRDAVAHRYAVLALDSVDRTNKQWSTVFSAQNPDIVNVLGAITMLTNRGLLPAGLPRFAVGNSNGGGFVAKMAYFGSYAAANAYCAQAGNAGGSTVPIAWNMAMSDTGEEVGSAGNAAALARYDVAVSRDVPASYLRHAPSPVHPRRFLRVNGLTATDSRKIYDAIKTRGFLDREDYLLAPPAVSGVSAAIPAEYAAHAEAISDQLRVCYADHKFFADTSRRTFEFFAEPSAAAARQMPRLGNLSTRAQTLAGDDVLIGGIIVQGAAGTNQPVLIRALGPSLRAHGVADAVADPQLQVFDATGVMIAENADWQGSAQRQQIIDTMLAPADGREAAAILNLAPGAYTAIVRGSVGTTGVALVEAYSLQPGNDARLANVSTRARVGVGERVLIGGLIVTGSGSKRMLLRALGPSVAAAGVPNALDDPAIDLLDGAGNLLAANGDWVGSGQQEQEIRATLLPPSSPVEAALLVTLSPGAYTVIVRGQNGAEGNALVEAYEVP